VLEQPVLSHASTPLLGLGQVIHQRLSPARHGFRYGVFFLFLRMRQGTAASTWGNHWWLSRNRFGLLSFYDADHGAQKSGLAWVEDILHSQGIHDADGDIWLQCFPRVLGYAFKPVSFWFCHRADGKLRCVITEVNNTFGERHAYLLDEGRALVWGEELTAAKVFHVSPFCDVQGSYRFRFMRAQRAAADDRLVVRIDYDAPNADDKASGVEQPLLQTSVSGSLAPATASRVLWAFVTHPLMTLAVIARIHWHALRLWLKRVPFFKKPTAPQRFLTFSERK
jgi:uncharacterized protein